MVFEIKTGKANVAELSATISEETASAAELSAKIEALSADIQTDEADLAAATKIRETENADFKAENKGFWLWFLIGIMLISLMLLVATMYAV